MLDEDKLDRLRFLAKALLVVIALPVLYFAWTALDVLRTSRQDERPTSDALVVMGAAQYNGKPSPVFKARLDHSLRLYRSKVAPLIVVLGGKKEGDRITEAQAGAAYLERVLPADKVTGVKAGTTTLDSLRKFSGLAKERNIDSIVIVSDPLHLRRAESMAADLGFKAATSPSSLPKSREGNREDLIGETMRLIFYRVFKQG